MVYARPALDLLQNDYDYQQKDNDYGDLDQVEVVEEVTGNCLTSLTTS